jgi:hypothetical protein
MAERNALWDFRSSLASLLQLGAWLVALIALFVLKPPRLSPTDDGLIFVHAVEFIAAIMLALVVVAIRRRGVRVRTLWLAAAASAVAAVIAFFGYVALTAVWTCSYDGRGPVVIGSTMLAGAARYAASLPGDGCETLIQDAVGNTARIWPQSELNTHHLILAGAFMATVLMFALAAMLAVETFRIGMPETKPR